MLLVLTVGQLRAINCTACNRLILALTFLAAEDGLGEFY
jgi:hypothetical protein